MNEIHKGKETQSKIQQTPHKQINDLDNDDSETIVQTTLAQSPLWNHPVSPIFPRLFLQSLYNRSSNCVCVWPSPTTALKHLF